MRLSYLLAVVRAVLSFSIAIVSVRLAYNWLGETNYGIWASLSATMVFLSFASDAMSQATQRFFSEAIGSGDFKKLTLTFSSSLVAFFGLSSIATIAAFLLMTPIIGGLEVSNDLLSSVRFAYLLVTLTAFLQICILPCQSLLVAAHKQTPLLVANILSGLGLLCLLSLLVRTSFPPIAAYAAIYTMTVLLKLIVVVLATFRGFPNLRFSFSLEIWGRLKEILPYASWSLLGRLNWAGRNSGTTVMTGVFFGPAYAAAYALGNRLVLTLLQFPSSAIGVAQAELGQSVGTGDHEHGLHVAQHFSLVQSWAGVGFVFFFLYYGESCMKLWLGDVPNGVAAFVALAAFYHSVAYTTLGYSLYEELLGRIRQVTLVVVIPQVLCFLAAVCIVYFGHGDVWTLPISFLVGSVFTSFVARPVYLHLIGTLKLNVWIGRIMCPIAVGILLCFLWAELTSVFWSNEHFVQKMILDLLGWGLITGVPFLLSYIQLKASQKS